MADNQTNQSQHFYLKQAMADYSKKDHKIHNTYYFKKNNIAYFSIYFTYDPEANSDQEDIEIMIKNIRLIMDRIGQNQYKIYSVESKNGAYIKKHGKMIYDESIDKKKGKHKKRNLDEDMEYDEDDEEDEYDE